ncbi:MAG: hypothetical protein A2921_02185 [Candidatus Magasanikbacteria bacterium RIFCSPLOWO2_01_FULL_43_20b]|uniref:Uncharacterized protein n=1 Tax=Candidatus Magasanikbacteria bacterium RIFCSPLOWO2_12_FULL_43_12 TaxID=1798692 RepID=A0A1F6MQH9_9BACT|nr:MAG: hypothetical protein A3C74_00510 [Candidatus Magasanikbacteria bacterium RIFCSPHIGHO2_02_FULL_44_13]OGH72314.1 MAG: hypothetical protein A3I93_04470 [Candidatus Magasanikbacteria bacterium RIFCSPLOWO2_02_FULL_43_22]OGH73398.1 MAG: hypothetical protein A2921_02185 [Candidatus Magasanikbacteria bacterium RIFCSPLOWO2_01_FULL_43_20b]OGH73897.1 MAG: hypothetical protein A3G00_01650 [Candidatus Magasanikbacteria bacterium RIFCSPLOWO2_12_FULL_43_12]
MLTVPLYFFLFAYLIFLAIFAVFSILNFYHVLETVSFTLTSFITSFFIFSLTVLTLYFTQQLLIEIDWQTPVVLFNSNWVSNIFNF